MLLYNSVYGIIYSKDHTNRTLIVYQMLSKSVYGIIYSNIIF